jgi:ABC-type long-subunit fatty acid transport system fused permease/ATPase subunit
LARTQVYPQVTDRIKRASGSNQRIKEAGMRLLSTMEGVHFN